MTWSCGRLADLAGPADDHYGRQPRLQATVNGRHQVPARRRQHLSGRRWNGRGTPRLQLSGLRGTIGPEDTGTRRPLRVVRFAIRGQSAVR
jgi:hypothetical protein